VNSEEDLDPIRRGPGRQLGDAEDLEGPGPPE